MDIYEEFKIPKVINSSGKMTYLGSSVLDPQVAEAMYSASQSYVHMDELMDKAGERFAKLCQSEAACVCAGASAGIIIAVAAVITGGNDWLVEQVPYVNVKRRKILISTGHCIHFGAPIKQMLLLGGGIPVEVGTVCKTLAYHYEEAIDDETAAIFYVKSHHASQTDQLSLKEVIEIARAHQLPVILDAAAEEDLRSYVQMGCDLVLYSGAKAIGGPTSGIILGTKAWIEACRKQYHGVARPMKVGKENILGLWMAIEKYQHSSSSVERQLAIVQAIIQELSSVEGLTVSVAQDSAGREIYRAKIVVDEAKCGMNAVALDRALKLGNEVVYTRNHNANQGILLLDPRVMKEGDAEIVCGKIRQILERRNER